LHDNDFHSVSLEDWRKAMVAQQPLPGRAMLLTFDDGTLDFLTYAWPLLQRYGFSAIVFLVAEEIGGSNRWDRAYGEVVPLLGWQETRDPLFALPRIEVMDSDSLQDFIAKLNGRSAME
jgi:peptidoglycan/xylan/chitin deacetylase (PgdA/CDA1 family)